MRKLLDEKITRERRTIGDYIPAKDQATVDGCADFLQRQRERMKAAQAQAAEAKVKVRKIK